MNSNLLSLCQIPSLHIVLSRLSVVTSTRATYHRRLENLLPLRMVRTAKLEAHRVTEWRVDLRTPTRARFVVSFVPQAPLHCCTPARHSSALGSLHTFSLQRTSHTPRTLLRRESILSLSLSLSRFDLLLKDINGAVHLTGAPISLGSRRERQLRNERDRASASWTMWKPDRCEGRLFY